MVPRISHSAVEELRRLEQRIGRPLPAAVREWYSIEGARDVLQRYSNDDWVLPISEMGKPRKDTHYDGPHDLVSRNLLVFRYENQSVCVWAVELDGSDDPPVVVDVDTQFRHWQRCADTFSIHVFSWVWDYALVFGRDLLIQAQHEVLSESALMFLCQEFEQGPVTFGWPGHTQYRFLKDDQCLLIWASENQADWWLSAGKPESMKRLVHCIWDCDFVGKSLWSNTSVCDGILDSARKV
jgi:hypothetical protein